MNIRHIKQAVTEESLFGVMRKWCAEGAGKTKWELRIVSAFVSGGAVRALEPLLDVFLADGNSVQIIFGVDRNGTDRAAVRRLHALTTAYRGQVVVKLFRAPSQSSIFHPKLYLLLKDKSISGVIGSANLTLSGLGSNLESLILCEDCAKSDEIAKEMLSVWSLFADPVPPLRREFLRRLTRKLRARLLAMLPTRSREENSADKTTAKWQPLSRIKLPRTRTRSGRKPVPQNLKAFMVYEIMEETRHTQMQVPLAVVEQFFGIRRDKPADIDLSIVTGKALSQPISRPVVISKGREGQRLMRRIEMPTIRDLERPLIAVFIKLNSRGSFAYKLFPRRTKAHAIVDRILDEHGQQGKGDRRYYVGKIGDSVWEDTRKLIGVE